MRKSQEIRNRIVVADIFHHLFQKLQVRRVLPVFHPVSDLIAENPAEIFVAREGEEAAGVGQHADEGGEHADAGKRRKLGFHAVFVIVEPPCGTMLANEATQQEKEKMAELYALMNVYATAGHAQDLKADVEGNKEYQLWQEYDRTDIYAMYLEEIMEDAVCDYNVFSRGQE